MRNYGSLYESFNFYDVLKKEKKCCISVSSTGYFKSSKELFLPKITMLIQNIHLFNFIQMNTYIFSTTPHADVFFRRLVFEHDATL